MSKEPLDLDVVKEVKARSPFKDLKIQDDDVLYKHTERLTCSTCKKQVKHYCYYCYKVVGMDRSEVPYVKLPVTLDVIKHEKELDGKSTALHAKILAPEDVQVYGWNSMPDYENPDRVLVLYPGDDAKKLSDIPRDSFDHLIVIDGTWNQAKKMVRDTPALQKMRRVTIEPRLTYFWRFQSISTNYLATIEAIYYLYMEFAMAYETADHAYDGRYDNILFYYKYLYDLIQYSYIRGQHKNKNFCWRHRSNYIKDKPLSAKEDAMGKSVDSHNETDVNNTLEDQNKENDT